LILSAVLRIHVVDAPDGGANGRFAPCMTIDRGHSILCRLAMLLTERHAQG
jgi:hypothetical protein